MLYRFCLAAVAALVMSGHVHAAECPEVAGLPGDKVAEFLEAHGRGADPQCVADGILRLGYLRPKIDSSQIEVLVGFLDFQMPETGLDKYVSSMTDRFPAVSALCDMENLWCRI
jgi:hypothetical protein